MQHKIRYGYPEVGWDGDPWATLCYNKLLDCFELWYEKDTPVILMRSQPGKKLPSLEELCIHLRDHDLHKWSAHAILNRVDKHNEAVQKAIQDKYHSQQAAALEKVYWHVGREIGEYRPVIGGFKKK